MRPYLLMLGLVAALVGCQSTPAPRSAGEERPRSLAEARWWEGEGDKELGRAYSSDNLAMRERHFAWAIQDFRHARDLYFDELYTLETQATKENPIPTGRREALDIEIDRLTREITQLVRDRPIEEPAPIRLEQKIAPKY